MAGRQSSAHDRARRGQLQGRAAPWLQRRPWSTTRSSHDRARLLRLPAQRLRDRGHARPCRRGGARRRRGRSTPAPSPPRPSARRARRSARPGASIPRPRIVVTGCAAQIDPASFAAMPEVDQVLGNEEKLPARDLHAACRRRSPADRGRRHHDGARDRCHAGRRPSKAAPAPSCRSSRAAIIAAPSASSPTAAATTAAVPMGEIVTQARAAGGGGRSARSC